MRKKLNSKGFTLIELLAVIVILALIMVIAIPRVLDAMDSSRRSALHSSAKGVANWYSETVVADGIVKTHERVIPTDMYGSGDTKISKDTWLCMDKVVGTPKDASGNSLAQVNLLELAGVSKDDVVISTTTGASVPSSSNGNCTGTITVSATTKYCAAICIPSAGKPRVYLQASETGKFYVSGVTTYADSEAQEGNSVAP